MQLVTENKLVWSPVVANSRMNRSRNANGINSYEQEFKFRPETFLEKRIKINGRTAWLDLCCGEGLALLQTAAYLSAKGFNDRVILKGIDLVDSYATPDNSSLPVNFETVALFNWTPNENYDLITCSHGLHYLGDKLKIIERIIANLRNDGLFIANLDLNNIFIDGKNQDVFLKNLFKKIPIGYNSRTKIVRREGNALIKFPLLYIGADDNAGPNYTGQEAVNSYYSKKR